MAALLATSKAGMIVLGAVKLTAKTMNVAVTVIAMIADVANVVATMLTVEAAERAWEVPTMMVYRWVPKAVG